MQLFLQKLQLNIFQGFTIADEYLTQNEKTNSTVLDHFKQQDSLCRDLSPSALGSFLNEELKDLLYTLINLKDYMTLRSKQMVLSLHLLSKQIERMISKIDIILTLWSTSSIILTLTLGCLSCFLGIEAFLGHQRYEIIVIPLFVLLIIILWLLSCALAFVAVACADICYNSPNHTTLTLLKQYEKNLHPIIYKAIRYYIMGCNGEANDIFVIAKILIINVLKELDDSLSSISLLKVSDFTEICGQDVTPTLDMILYLSNFLASTHTSAENLLQLFEFHNFHPIYTTLAYDGLCYHGISGITWMFILLPTFSCCGLLMICALITF